MHAELLRATDNGRADAVIREYSLTDDGWKLLDEDRAMLDTMGYELKAQEEVSGWGYDERLIKALFVRKAAAAPSPAAPQWPGG